MVVKPYDSYFVSKVGRSFEEVYLLEMLSVMGIPESHINQLKEIGRTSFKKLFNYELDFGKAIERLVIEGLVTADFNPKGYFKHNIIMYLLSDRGKEYCKEKGISDRAVDALERDSDEEYYFSI